MVRDNYQWLRPKDLEVKCLSRMRKETNQICDLWIYRIRCWNEEIVSVSKMQKAHFPSSIRKFIEVYWLSIVDLGVNCLDCGIVANVTQEALHEKIVVADNALPDMTEIDLKNATEITGIRTIFIIGVEVKK